MSMGTDYRQTIEQTFGIVMCVAVGSDQTGTEAFDRVETMKYEVIKAIAGRVCPRAGLTLVTIRTKSFTTV